MTENFPVTIKIESVSVSRPDYTNGHRSRVSHFDISLKGMHISYVGSG